MEKEKAEDLISRKVAIDALIEHRALYCDNTPDTFSKLSYAEKSRVDELDTAIATLVNLPSVDVREVMASAWIPVTERLPEVYTMYLVTLDDGSVYFLYWEWDDDFKHWVDEDGNGDYIVTAWMPLPESFKP